MPLTLRPATSHTHSVGTPEYSFLNGYFDYLYTLLISSVNMSVSGTIAAGNLTCTNRIVGKIFAIVESDVDIMYIDKYLAKFPQDGEFARNLTVGSKISAVTAEISLAIKTKDLLVESALETGTALVNDMLQVEGSTWLKGGLTVQGNSSINGSLNVNGSLAGYAISGTSMNVGSGSITGGAISGSSGNFAGGSVTAGTFIGALSGNATTATTATNATNATNATYAATAGYATTAGSLEGGTQSISGVTTLFYPSIVTDTARILSEGHLSVPGSSKTVFLIVSLRGTMSFTTPYYNSVHISVVDSAGTIIFTIFDGYNYNGLGQGEDLSLTGHRLLNQSSDETYYVRVSAGPGYMSIFECRMTALVF